MLQVGERIGDYEVLQILGAGGMGQVYKVRNSITDRIEAMKVLLPDLVGDPELADRFLREIKVQASLVHRNIAQLYSARREGDQIVMVMEFVDGLTLDSLLRRGPLNTQTVVSLFGQVLDALAFAHAHGVVHRDIKPQNIMVTPDGTAKLMDFGIARMSQDQRLTQTGRTLGSLFYMSPEQIRGDDEIDGRSDLYSLGVTLYEAATGSRPFEGTSDYSIMAAHLQSPPVPPIERDSRLPQVLSDVIMAAIEKDRDQRFRNAEAFKAALQHAVSNGSQQPVAAAFVTPPPQPPPPKIPTQPMMTAPVPPISATAPFPQTLPPPPPPMPPPPRPVSQRSNAGLMMGVGALAFAAIAGLGVWQYPRMFPPKPAPETAAVTTPAQEPAAQPVAQTPAPVIEEKKPVAVDPVPSNPVAEPVPEQKIPAAVAETKPPVVFKPKEQPPHKEVAQARPVEVEKPQYQPPQVVHEPQPQAPPPPNQEPQVNPAVMREVQELRARYNHLSIRLSGCKESMDSLEAQQRSQGFGLRGDLKDASRLAQERMREVQNALRSRDIETAKTNLDLAERSIEFLAKALGR